MTYGDDVVEPSHFATPQAACESQAAAFTGLMAVRRKWHAPGDLIQNRLWQSSVCCWSSERSGGDGHEPHR
jgi:hypothetical protein